MSAIGSAYTGSTPALLAYLRGQHIYLDRTTATLGEVRPGAEYDVPFAVQNLTRRPIRIVGLKATCSCVVAFEVAVTSASSDFVGFLLAFLSAALLAGSPAGGSS